MAELLTPIKLLVHRLSSGADISRDATEALQAAGGHIKYFSGGQQIGGGDEQTLWLLSQGWAFRQKVLSDGRRKITALMLPGELTHKPPHLPFLTSHQVVAATPVEAQAIDRERLTELCEAFPEIVTALLAEELLQSALAAEWNVTLGAGRAEEKLAYFFYETFIRLHAMGLAPDKVMDFPLTQEEVGDIIGITPVHVNRVLQLLRSKGLISWTGKKVTIEDPEAIALLANFNEDLDRAARELGARATLLRQRRLSADATVN